VKRVLVALVGLSLCGCSLILDFDGDLVDGAPEPMVDADPLAPDAPPDPATVLEPNNTMPEAATITAGTYGPMAVSPVGDHDFFRFTLTEAHQVTVEAQFTQSMGDLDMRLYDGTGTKIGESAGFVDNETIECTAASALKCMNRMMLDAGDYYVEVYGFNNMQTNPSYLLVLTIL
jgi:hypothetical protein